jgi:GrpB-like predicted nucleotidyltransferase (UPF0157 family)
MTPHDRTWAAAFQKEASRIRGAAGLEDARLEHVGSTAIEGMAADPVIDLVLGTGSHDPRGAIEGLGYRVTPDPGPGTSFVRRSASRRFHLRVMDEGGEDLQAAVALRAYLRFRPDQAERFVRLKAILAEGLRFDRFGYAEAKAPYLWVMGQRRKEEGFDGP